MNKILEINAKGGEGKKKERDLFHYKNEKRVAQKETC